MKEHVILIHGFGEDSRIWYPFVKPLEQNYNVITPDLKDSEGVTMEILAEQINDLLEKENISSCSMIGHSMGGYVTLAFAEKYSQKLNRLGLFHSTAFADSEEKIAARKKNIEFIKKHGSKKFIEQSIPKLFAEESNKKRPDIVKEIISRYSNLSPDSLVHYTEAMMKRPDRIEVLKNFRKPVLFIMGEYDTAIPLEQSLKQCSVPEFSYIYIAAHSGHLGMIEEPEFCLNALQDFLSGK